MDRDAGDRYLERIGHIRPPGATDTALHDLHEAHLMAVPFENLSIHLGEPIELEEASLLDKLVGRRRGGFCYELNGAFALLLGALGFDVTLLAARVFGSDGLGPPFDHLALRVDAPLPGTVGPWIVDVGFGDHAILPLALDDRRPRADPAGEFQVVETADGDLDVIKDGRPQYRIEMRPRIWADFVPMCWWHQTSPKSHFTEAPVCSLALPRGRVTVSDRRLITTLDGVRTETILATDDELRAAYHDHFGFVLPAVPARR
jgi:N-hydroxyarylamine O-acetyltransferase